MDFYSYLLDYRCLFLISIVFVFALYRIRTNTNFFGFINKNAILSLLMAVAVFSSIGLFVLLITDINPYPFIRTLGYNIGLQQLVDYADAIPPHFQDNYAVKDVFRQDVDGDGFNEWLVTYTYNAGSGETPITGIIYDNDRGSPPVIFPYALTPPNSEPLSTGDYRITYGDGEADIAVWGYDNWPMGIPSNVKPRILTLFKHQEQAGNPWDMPSDNPRRFVPFGYFVTDGHIDDNIFNKEVIVFDKGAYGRSQLGVYKVYKYDEKNGGYMDQERPNQLKQPDIETINFYPNPPSNMEVASYPEQIVLAFYASMCNGSDQHDLCQHKYDGLDWTSTPQTFLIDTAKERFGSQDWAYFGLPGRSVGSLSVHDINYQSEQPNLASLVTISFTAGQQSIQSVTMRLRRIEGKWKITEVVELQAATLGGN